MTEFHQEQSAIEHCGIILKSFVPSTTFPFKWKSCQYTVDDFVNILESPVHLHWNSSMDQYPLKYQQRLSTIQLSNKHSHIGFDSGGFSQESTSVITVGDGLEESYLKKQFIDSIILFVTGTDSISVSVASFQSVLCTKGV